MILRVIILYYDCEYVMYYLCSVACTFTSVCIYLMFALLMSWITTSSSIISQITISGLFTINLNNSVYTLLFEEILIKYGDDICLFVCMFKMTYCDYKYLLMCVV